MNPNDIVIEIRPDKKRIKIWPFIALFEILIIVAASIVIVWGLNNKNDNSNDSNEVVAAKEGNENGGMSSGAQELFNATAAPTDTLSIFMKDSDDPNLNIFLGFKLDHISEDLELIPYASIKNKHMRIISYGSGGIDLEYSGRKFYYISSSEYLVYRPATTSKKASINTDEIVYNAGNYYVTYDSFTKDYEAYYKYGTTTNVSMDLKTGEEGWKLIKFDYYDTKEDAIARVKKLSTTSEICFYTDSEGISKCKNTKSYNNLNDIILKELAKKGIYVKSYKNIDSLDFSDLSVINDARDMSFRIGSMILGSPVSDSSRYSSFEMKGKKYYIDYHEKKDFYGLQGGIYLPDEGSDSHVTSFSVKTSDNIRKTREEVIEEFKAIFGK